MTQGMMELIDCDVPTLGLVLGASVSQSSFPTWGSGYEARLVIFQPWRPPEVRNGTGVSPAPAGSQPLWETGSERDTFKDHKPAKAIKAILDAPVV